MHYPLEKSIVIKIGGSTLGSHDTTLEDVVALQKDGMLPVIVHGGGDEVTGWLARLGISTRFVNGLRVTDADTLKVVVAVLAGLVNKELVAAISALGGQAMGLSGVDGGFIEAQISEPELGYTGEVVSVNLEPLKAILGAGYIPIISPVSLESPAESGRVGAFLNVNGDTAASEIAAALGAERLIFLTDVVGVCDSSGELIPRLTPDEAKALIESGVASGGMIPKIEACLNASSAVSITRIIDGRVAHALLNEIEGMGKGTTIG